MPQQLEQFHAKAGQSVRMAANDWRLRALRLLRMLAMGTMLAACGTMLAACGRCGDFLGSSQSQIGACHSDPAPQQ